MSEPNTQPNEDPESQRATAAKGRRTAAKATAPAARATKSAATKADDAASATRNGVERAAGATAGAAHTAARGVEAGRQAIVATSGQVAATARTAWTVIAQRKLVAAGVGAGLTALTAASYAVGRRSGHHTHGPITRLTGGRI
ncbi:hypothetical protein [Streptomyces aurantiogriseus]|uniref:Uncharacterized protein n=1 Tax=Streptomyces aurantiogriseus TaxID=66870 RepID=A0A918FJL6_9ACTN|nr:hypothetical protein [Streptomyces aurantiogriseus]GGR42345.1 hypothetical protein GCM10010251_69210 [Streptomyces aurantiogriseus]